MGMFGGETKTTQQLEVPAWMEGMPEDLATGVMDLLDQPLLTPEEQVAGLTENQTDAADQMAAYGQEGGQGMDIQNALFGAGMQGVNQVGQGQQYINDALSGGPAQNQGADMNQVGSYINNDVLSGQIDAVNRDVMRQFSEQDSPNSRMAQALSGNSGSTRGAIGDAILQRGAMDRMGDNAASIRGAAYGQSLGLASNEASQNASLQNQFQQQQIGGGQALVGTSMDSASLLNMSNATGMQNMNLLMQSGGIEQAQEQALKDAAMGNVDQQWQNQAQANAQISGAADQYGAHTTTTEEEANYGAMIATAAGAAMTGGASLALQAGAAAATKED